MGENYKATPLIVCDSSSSCRKLNICSLQLPVFTPFQWNVQQTMSYAMSVMLGWISGNKMMTQRKFSISSVTYVHAREIHARLRPDCPFLTKPLTEPAHCSIKQAEAVDPPAMEVADSGARKARAKKGTASKAKLKAKKKSPTLVNSKNALPPESRADGTHDGSRRSTSPEKHSEGSSQTALDVDVSIVPGSKPLLHKNTAGASAARKVPEPVREEHHGTLIVNEQSSTFESSIADESKRENVSVSGKQDDGSVPPIADSLTGKPSSEKRVVPAKKSSSIRTPNVRDLQHEKTTSPFGFKRPPPNSYEICDVKRKRIQKSALTPGSQTALEKVRKCLPSCFILVQAVPRKYQSKAMSVLQESSGIADDVGSPAPTRRPLIPRPTTIIRQIPKKLFPVTAKCNVEGKPSQGEMEQSLAFSSTVEETIPGLAHAELRDENHIPVISSHLQRDMPIDVPWDVVNSKLTLRSWLDGELDRALKDLRNDMNTRMDGFRVHVAVQRKALLTALQLPGA